MNWLINLFQSVVFQTIISGVLVFVIAQIIQKFFIEVIQKYKATIGKIDNKLKFYANVIANPGILPKDIILKCSHEIRNLSCELEMTYKQIPFTFVRKIINSPALISDSAGRLIRLSNSLYQGDALKNYDDVKKIRENLSIPEL